MTRDVSVIYEISIPSIEIFDVDTKSVTVKLRNIVQRQWPSAF